MFSFPEHVHAGHAGVAGGHHAVHGGQLLPGGIHGGHGGQQGRVGILGVESHAGQDDRIKFRVFGIKTKGCGDHWVQLGILGIHSKCSKQHRV